MTGVFAQRGRDVMSYVGQRLFVFYILDSLGDRISILMITDFLWRAIPVRHSHNDMVRAWVTFDVGIGL